MNENGELPPNLPPDDKEPKEQPEKGKEETGGRIRGEKPETEEEGRVDFVTERVFKDLAQLREDVDQDMPPVPDSLFAAFEESRKGLAEQDKAAKKEGVTRIPLKNEPKFINEDPEVFFEEIRKSLRAEAEGRDLREWAEEVTGPGGKVLDPEETLTERALNILETMYPGSKTIKDFVEKARKPKETPPEEAPEK